jgi:hypothetical protein
MLNVFSLSVVVADLTASSADYSLQTTTVTFNPGDFSKIKPVILHINDDQIVEPQEILQLTLSTSDAPVNTTNKTIVILDDDSKCFYFN